MLYKVYKYYIFRRVADSFSTVNHITAKHNRGEVSKTLPKKRQRSKTIVRIDVFIQNAFQNVIYEMYRNSERVSNILYIFTSFTLSIFLENHI